MKFIYLCRILTFLIAITCSGFCLDGIFFDFKLSVKLSHWIYCIGFCFWVFRFHCSKRESFSLLNYCSHPHFLPHNGILKDKGQQETHTCHANNNHMTKTHCYNSVEDCDFAFGNIIKLPFMDKYVNDVEKDNFSCAG